MRLGCIDIGSNTTRLLVADCDGRRLQVVHEERAYTRIGSELLENDALGAAKIAEVIGVVAAQAARAHRDGVIEIWAVATDAIRRAANGAELVRAITAATGLAIDVLSGEEEARLAFIGAAATLEQPVDGELGVVDVGGGSSELVVGHPPSEVGWWASVNLGSAALTHVHLRHDPPEPAEIAAARAAIERALAPLSVPPPAVAVAVGGSATCLA
ncbi:MAG: Ppx/GppA family phosphatase, partial [Actinomycetota bacterium]|nr:Ppx/GppA family phosphatase [Actinomycetota bacterium]